MIRLITIKISFVTTIVKITAICAIVNVDKNKMTPLPAVGTYNNMN